MIYRRITSTSDPLFKSCWDIYCSNFPLEERRDLLEQKRIFNTYCNNPQEENNIFIFNALLEKCDNNKNINGNIFKVDGVNCSLVGIFSYWNFTRVAFGEHLAISQNVQGMGIGKIAIDHLKRYATEQKKPILLEIEVPRDSITRRRESFYKKLGFKENPHEHFQPCYHKGDEPIEMVIMTWPEVVDEAAYNQFRTEQQAIMPVF